MLEHHSLYVLAPVCSVTEKKKKKKQVFVISHDSKKQYH